MKNFKKDYQKIKKSTINKIKKLGQDKIRGLRLLIIGTTLIFGLSVYRISQEIRLSFYTNPVPVENKLSPAPIQIRLPRFKVTLDVVPANIENGLWSIDELNANHLSSSSNPGDNGNIVIYGHNSNDVFGPLRWTVVGDEIVIKNAEDKEFIYQISSIQEVSPEDIQFVESKDKETLTLYTCSGFLNRKRHVVIAYPKSEEILDINF